MKFSDMEFENGKTPIPKEIGDYYMNHKEYEKYMIPLNAETCRNIAQVLDGEKIMVDLEDLGIQYISPPPMQSETIC